VGQGATMQANQSLNALGQQGALANTQAGQQIAGVGANTQAQLGEQNALLGSIGGYNSAQAGSQASVNAANAGLANTQMKGGQDLLGGLGNAAGSALGLADGGQVQSGPLSSIAKFMALGVAQGGDVKGLVKAKDSSEKAKVKGNSYSNDKIPAVLSEGEVVLPRDVMNSSDPVSESAKFVQAVLAKRRRA
jgi:hypothetical protein